MDLFVYGTLRALDLMTAVVGSGRWVAIPASLSGFAVHTVADNVVPFIAREQGASANGSIWQDVTETQRARLDLYEGAFGYTLEDVEVDTPDGPRTAKCYMPPPGIMADPSPWSLADWEAHHLAPALLAAAELFSHDPLPSHAQLRSMWPMIEARAWSKHRAQVAPASRRHKAQPADFPILKARPPHGQFFRFQNVDVSHRTFAGGQSVPHKRDAFIGIDAAVILPYDPARDRFLLVEQARLGPRLRHDPNPWMLEPVAGIVDARETPEQAALRECHEEAALDIRVLEPAGSFYVSPGASTDYFYTYVGLCDLPQTDPYLGGLPGEGEDLRLHPMSFDDAMALADSGEIATGPALYLLYWVMRHKARLQALV